MTRKRHTKGVTLIELMMVRIIGSLFAIATPVFVNPRNAFCRVECGDRYPAALADGTALVDAGGADHVTPRPKNPWTGAGMVQAGGVCDYTCTQTGGGMGFALSGRLSDGDFVVPSL